jgi:hypothetical protein
MAQAANPSITSRFHNLSNEALADALGHADAFLKGADAECKALKDETRTASSETIGQSFHKHPTAETNRRLLAQFQCARWRNTSGSKPEDRINSF